MIRRLAFIPIQTPEASTTAVPILGQTPAASAAGLHTPSVAASLAPEMPGQSTPSPAGRAVPHPSHEATVPVAFGLSACDRALTPTRDASVSPAGANPVPRVRVTAPAGHTITAEDWLDYELRRILEKAP